MQGSLQLWSYVINCTVPLKSKLTLETRTSRLDPRASMLETFEDRVSRIEYRVSRIESQVSRIEKQGFLEYAKPRKGFEKSIYFSKEEWYSTAHT